MLAALSGLAMFHPALFWLSGLFGGGPWTRILHPFVGLFMVLAFLFLALASGVTTIWAARLAVAEADRRRDQQSRGPAAGIGSYNAGQKLLFWSWCCAWPLLLTGIVIWRAYFSFYFPIA